MHTVSVTAPSRGINPSPASLSVCARAATVLGLACVAECRVSPPVFVTRSEQWSFGAGGHTKAAGYSRPLGAAAVRWQHWRLMSLACSVRARSVMAGCVVCAVPSLPWAFIPPHTHLLPQLPQWPESHKTS